MDEFRQADAIKEAEKKIRKILIDLEDDAEIKIEDVRVDTRNFANMAVEILFE